MRLTAQMDDQYGKTLNEAKVSILGMFLLGQGGVR